MADPAEFRSWTKLLKSKNTDKLLEGLSHCHDFAFISTGGGLVPLMNLLDTKKTNKDVLLGASGALARWAADRHGLAILRHGARKNTHWSGLERFVKLLQAKGCGVELAVSAFTTIGAVADLVNTMPPIKDDPSSQRAQYRARLGEMSLSMSTMVPFLRHGDAAVRERAIRALLHLTTPASSDAEKYDHSLSRRLRQAAIDAGTVGAALAYLRSSPASSSGQSDGVPVGDNEAMDGSGGDDVNNMHWLALGLLANLTYDVTAQRQILREDGVALLVSVLREESNGASAAEDCTDPGAENPVQSQKRMSMATALKAAVVVVTRVVCLALANYKREINSASPHGVPSDANLGNEGIADSTVVLRPAMLPDMLPTTLVQLVNAVSELSLSPEGEIPLLCAACESIGRLGSRATGGYAVFLSACALQALLNVFEGGAQAARESAEKAIHVLIPFLEVKAPDGDGVTGGPGGHVVSSIVELLHHSCAAVRCGAVRLATALICRIGNQGAVTAFARSGSVAHLLNLLGEKQDVSEGIQPFSSRHESAAHAALCLARLSSCDERACAAIGCDPEAVQAMLTVLVSGPITPDQFAESVEIEDTVLHNPALRSWGAHAIGSVVMPPGTGEFGIEQELSVNIRAVFLDLLAAIAEGDLSWRKFDDGVNVDDDGADDESGVIDPPPSTSDGESGALALFEAGPKISPTAAEFNGAGVHPHRPGSIPGIVLSLLDKSQHKQVRLSAMRLLTALPTVQVGNGRKILLQVLLGGEPQSDILPASFCLPRGALGSVQASCPPTEADHCAAVIASLLRGVVSIFAAEGTASDEIWSGVRLLASLCRDESTRLPNADCRQSVLADLIAGEALNSGVLVMLISLLHSAPKKGWAQDFILYLVCRGCVRESFWKVSEEEIQEDGEVVSRTTGRPDPNGGPTKSSWSVLLDSRASYGRYCHSSRTALHAAASSGNSTITGSLLEAGASVNVFDIENITPLILAINSGCISLAERLIDAGADYDAVTCAGDNVLKYAFLMPDRVHGGYTVSPGAPRLIPVLLRGGADPNIADENGNHPLHWALAGARIRCVVSFCLVDIRSESTELLDVLSTLVGAGAQVNVSNREGQTPLHIAVSGGHVAAAVALTVNFSADPNVADAGGNLPLHYACASPAFEPLVRVLLTAGASRPIRRGAFVDLGRGLRRSEKLLRSLNVVLMDGLRRVLSPPAIEARQASKEDILGSGNELGATPLHVASGGWAMLGVVEREKRAPCVINTFVCDLEERCRALRGMISGNYGCNCDGRRVTKKDASALHLLPGTAGANSDLASRAKSIVRIMCGELANATTLTIEARDAAGRSCLSISFTEGISGTCSSLASYLLHKGAVGDTGLHAACTVGARGEVITKCLGENSVAHLDASGNSALHVAAACGNASAVSAILSDDLSIIDQVGRSGNSALHLACSLPNDAGFDVVEMLAQGGSDMSIVNFDGKTALHLAIGRDNACVATLLVGNDGVWNLPRDLYVLLFIWTAMNTFQNRVK